jgi:DnaJ domain
MPGIARDAYQALGVRPDISDQELHRAYRRLVQLHHPDHNDGSRESARRFEEVQDAYSQIRELREMATSRGSAPRAGTETRLADLERQVREAHLARERARRAASEAAARTERRPTDEELGYVTTDDSFSKLLADARAELAERVAEARDHPATHRLADLIDELASKMSGEQRGHSRDDG